MQQFWQRFPDTDRPAEKQASPLKDALKSASNAVKDGDLATAVSYLGAFQDAVSSLYDQGVLSADQGLALFTEAGNIIAKLQSTSGITS